MAENDGKEKSTDTSKEKSGKGDSWSEIIKEVSGLTAGTPWWARTLIVPALVLIGIVLVTNHGIGTIMLENLLLLIQDLRDSVVDGVKSASNWATEKKDELVTALDNYFSEQRLARWRFNRNLYLAVAGVFIIVGLWNHATSIFLFVGILMLALPLLVIGLILANAGKDHWWNGLGGYILYAIAIVLLIAGSWMFIPNLVIWGVVMTLWLGTILFFKPFSRSKNAIRTVSTTLCFFIGAMLIGKILFWSYGQFPVVQRTIDGIQAAARGGSARALKGGTGIQDSGENTLMVAKFPTDVFKDVPKKIDENTGELIGENLLYLKVGDTVRVSNVSPKLDALGRSLVPATFRDKNTNKLRRGWVALMDIEDPSKKPQPASANSGNSGSSVMTQPTMVYSNPGAVTRPDGGDQPTRGDNRDIVFCITWEPRNTPVLLRQADGSEIPFNGTSYRVKGSPYASHISLRAVTPGRPLDSWTCWEVPLPEDMAPPKVVAKPAPKTKKAAPK